MDGRIDAKENLRIRLNPDEGCLECIAKISAALDGLSATVHHHTGGETFGWGELWR